MHTARSADGLHGASLELLKWARANGCKWDEETCTAAARGGHLEVLQWARAEGMVRSGNVEFDIVTATGPDLVDKAADADVDAFRTDFDF